jgi:hypothetical protein
LIFVAAVLAFSLGTSGCGYSLSGRGSFLPAYIKVIGVPMFVNNTPVFDVEKRITERVQAELIGRGKYKVQPDATGVDGLLTGEITSVTLTPSTFTNELLAASYVLTLTAKVEFKDMKTAKILWSNPSMQFRQEYDVVNGSVADPSTFLGQDQNAMERLATEFARSLVSAILEAF